MFSCHFTLQRPRRSKTRHQQPPTKKLTARDFLDNLLQRWSYAFKKYALTFLYIILRCLQEDYFVDYFVEMFQAKILIQFSLQYCKASTNYKVEMITEVLKNQASDM